MNTYMRYRFVGFFVLTLIACSVGTHAQEKIVDLQPRFVVGQQSRYSLWSKRTTQVQVTVMDKVKSHDAHYTVEGESTWTVLSVNDDGSAQCQMTFDWLTLKITMPDGTVQNNDTRDGTNESDRAYEVLAAMVGQPVELSMAADGSVTAVSGTDAMRNSAAEDVRIPEDLDFIESASDLATLPFAPAKATVNQNWDTSFRWTHEMGHLNHDVQFTLDSVRKVHGIELATISGKGTLTLDLAEDKLPPSNDDVDVNVVMDEGTIEHQILMDLSRHEVIGRNTLQKTVISTSMRSDKFSVAQTTTETVQGQALRISETDPQ